MVPAQAGVILLKRQAQAGTLSGSRASGGDPNLAASMATASEVVPAQAGVILLMSRRLLKVMRGSRVSGAIDVEFSHEADDRLIAGILKALPHVG